MVLIKVNDSIRKTDYYKELLEWNSKYNMNVDDFINIEISQIDDDFISLYFSLQENLNDNININFDGIDVYSIFLDINSFFYPGTVYNFPFEIQVYLIQHGYKKYFTSDANYLALLYETPLFYNKITSKKITLYHLVNNKLKINLDIYKKYNDYLISRYDIYIKNKKLIITSKNNKNTFKYDLINIDDNYVTSSLLDVHKKILTIDGLIICGDIVNRILNYHNPKNYYRDYGRNFDVFIYKQKNLNDIIYQIIEKVSGEYGVAYVYHTKEYIYITGDNNILVRILKRNFESIAKALNFYDIDSNCCGIYLDNDKIRTCYLDRFKFAYENRINILNPSKQSMSYNRQLMHNCSYGYSIFVPGEIHNYGNYFNINNIFPKYTFQHLLFSLMENMNNNSVKLYEKKNIFRHIMSLNGDNFDFVENLVNLGIIPEDDNMIENAENYILSKVKIYKENFDLELINHNNVFLLTLNNVVNILELTGATKNWEDGSKKLEGTNYDYLSIYQLQHDNDINKPLQYWQRTAIQQEN